jgi:hypothetical protein
MELLPVSWTTGAMPHLRGVRRLDSFPPGNPFLRSHQVIQVDRSDGLNDGRPPDQATLSRRQDMQRYSDCIVISLLGSHLRRSKVLDSASIRLVFRATTTHPRRSPDSSPDRVVG